VRHAVTCALRRESGVIGEDEERGDVLRAIEFPRIKGGKHFDIKTPWFTKLLAQIGQKAAGESSKSQPPSSVETAAEPGL
jgi:pyrophosphate--fructose-6-phosphate 1-phosphotransferase